MCPDGFLFHPTDPTSYLILSSHLLAETMEPSHVAVAFFPARYELLFISGCSGFWFWFAHILF